MKRLGLLLLVALGGCAHAPGGSVAGGECKFLERPQYVVRGIRQYDQDWIDSTIEGGVGACGWSRPTARPAELDAQPAKPAPVAKKPKPKGIWKMLRAWPHKAKPVVATPVAPSLEPVPVTPIVEPLPPAPPLRGPIDDLLDPK